MLWSGPMQQESVSIKRATPFFLLNETRKLCDLTVRTDQKHDVGYIEIMNMMVLNKKVKFHLLANRKSYKSFSEKIEPDSKSSTS